MLIRFYGGPYDMQIKDYPDALLRSGKLVLPGKIKKNWLEVSENVIQIPTVTYIRKMIPTIAREGDPEPWHFQS